MMKISLKIKSLMASVAVSAAVALGGLSAQAANETLKIGFVGVTSGPGKSSILRDYRPCSTKIRHHHLQWRKPDWGGGVGNC